MPYLAMLVSLLLALLPRSFLRQSSLPVLVELEIVQDRRFRSKALENIQHPNALFKLHLHTSRQPFRQLRVYQLVITSPIVLKTAQQILSLSSPCAHTRHHSSTFFSTYRPNAEINTTNSMSIHVVMPNKSQNHIKPSPYFITCHPSSTCTLTSGIILHHQDTAKRHSHIYTSTLALNWMFTSWVSLLFVTGLFSLFSKIM